jgi:hypothetical protein
VTGRQESAPEGKEVDVSAGGAADTKPDHRGALTIAAERLAGSPACLNCGTALQGPFCHYCGQPDKNLIRFFPALARELMQDFLEFDSRFWRTLKPLLFQPGKLTRDYLDGRRFRYTPPLRLYIFSSMGFFILAAMLAGSSISVQIDEGLTDTGDDGAAAAVVSPEEAQQAREALERIDPALADELDRALQAGSATSPEDQAESTQDRPLDIDVHLSDGDEDGDVINLNGEPWDRETNPVEIPFMPGYINDWINDEIEESPQKGKEIEANPNLIVDKIFDVLPVSMFILLPVVALLFKFWYLFARRYYVEHLILALHNHSFLFVALLLSMVSNSLAGWLEPAEEGPVTSSVLWLNIAIVCWLPVYFLLSLKRVYQQSWSLTTGKFLVIGLSYLILLLTTASVVSLISFVML